MSPIKIVLIVLIYIGSCLLFTYMGYEKGRRAERWEFIKALDIHSNH